MKPVLGLFDSGVGGLTVLRRVLERHGPVQCVYLGDTARVPYGTRSVEDIRSIASEVVGWSNSIRQSIGSLLGLPSLETLGSSGHASKHEPSSARH